MMDQPTRKMAATLRKRKREIQDVEVLDTRFSLDTQSIAKIIKRRRKTIHAPLQTDLIDKENMRLNTDHGQDFTPWKPPAPINKPDFTPQPLKRNGTLRGTLRRRVSMSVMKRKMRKFQDYSLIDSNIQYLQTLGRGSNGLCQPCPGTTDTDLQQKIEHEVKMREGTAKLLAASKHPAQMLEAARNLLTSNTRIIAYMTELQKRKTAEVLGKNLSMDGNQVPCKANLCVSDIRIPLMWKDTDHFKNKGDYRRFAVFCLVRIGTDIFDTSLISNVDRSMTDLTFDSVISFDNVPHNFECKLEVYCHKLHEDLTIASTPKKLRKKINDISGSVGRSVGKRLSGLNDADIIGNMVLGPRFELVAVGTMELKDVDDSVRTFDLQLESTGQASESGCEIPLFGHYCCRLAAQPDCLVQPEVTGYLNIQEDDDLAKWRRYWCILRNLQLSCWLSPGDVEITEPQITVPVTKNTQISDADPRTSERSHTFHIKTVQRRGTFQHTLAADSAEELSKWWDGLQQHLLDQAFWKHACEHVMPLKKPTPRKKPAFLRKGSLYEETPIEDTPANHVSDLKMEDDQLSKMLNTLMGEAKQIRGDNSHKSTSGSVS